jgi:signal transduction histidine kinase
MPSLPVRKPAKTDLPARGLRGRLWIAFVLQTVSIALATLFGVYAAMVVLRDVLIERALTDEATHYWNGRRENPDWPVPNTYNMHGYLLGPGMDSSSIPPSLRDLPPGFHALTISNADELIYVDQHGDQRLWLIFHQEQLRNLALWFGLVPLSFVLGAVYLVSFYTYRVSKRAVSPIIQLAQSVSALDPIKPDLSALEEIRRSSSSDQEVQTLAESIEVFAKRNEYFVERERDFTRDASHELRTPLTIIKIAADVMLADTEPSPLAEKSLYRIKRATRDMESLIEAFLILARESDVGLPTEHFVVNEVVSGEVDRAIDLISGKPIELKLRENAVLSLEAPSRVLSVMLSNLLRNAAQYTDKGEIIVTVGSDYVEVEDTGSGMSSEDAAHAFDPFYRGQQSGRGGHGVGLTIVKRLSDRFGWPVSIESELGRGTRARIRLSKAKAQ